MTVKVLLVGESWVTNSTHTKGFDQFSTIYYETGITELQKALKGSVIDLIHMPSHEAQNGFPFKISALKEYDVICLSDIGANSLLLSSETFVKFQPTPNRLKLIQQYVKEGGGFIMAGGYYSFQGFNGGAQYFETPIEEILPVEIFPYDDRFEVPEGANPEILIKDHPVTKGLGSEWPLLLGFNKVKIKKKAKVLAKFSSEYKDYPLLITGKYGKGRTLAWTSDIGPHWLSPDFCAWKGYKKLWVNTFKWLAGE